MPTTLIIVGILAVIYVAMRIIIAKMYKKD